MGGLLAAAVTLPILHAILIHVPRTRSLARNGLLLVLPAALLHGHLLHQGILGVLGTRDFSRNYAAWNENNWTWMEYLMKARNRNPDGSMNVLLCPGNAEYQYGMANAAATIGGVAPIEVEPCADPIPDGIDYVVSLHNPNHALDPSYLPPIQNGLRLSTHLLPSTGSRTVISLRSGDTMEFGFEADRDMLLAGFLLQGDSFPWHPALALECRVEAGKQTRERTLRGIEIPRSRAIPPILLEEPLEIRKGDPVRFRLHCVYERNPSSREVGTVVMVGQHVSETVGTMNGSESNVAPGLGLIVGTPIDPSFRRLMHSTSARASFVTMSPFNVYRYFLTVYPRGWQRDFFRPIRYEYGVEIYERREPGRILPEAEKSVGFP